MSAQFFWSCVLEVWGNGWRPTNFPEFYQLLAGGSGQVCRLTWVNFDALAWSLWCVTNKLVIEHIFPSRATDDTYKLCGFLQLWRPLSKRWDRAVVDQLTRRYEELAAHLLMITYPP